MKKKKNNKKLNLFKININTFGDYLKAKVLKFDQAHIKKMN